MLQNKIRRGERDRQITFIEEVVSRGTSNQDVLAWRVITSKPTVWAKKTEQRGAEMVIGDQLKYVQTTVFNIDYREDLTTKNRLVYQGRVYEITSITEGETRRTDLNVVANLLDNEIWT